MIFALRSASRSRIASTCLLSATLTGAALLPAPAFAWSTAWVYSFTGGTDGANPIAGLTLNSGSLYGAAFFGGANGQGTLFSIPTTGGTPTVLHAFDATAGDGAGPGGTPIFDTSNTALLGTTTFASINSSNVGSGNGTVYSYVTTGSSYSVLHTFAGGSSDGANPYAGLLKSRCSSNTVNPPPFYFYGTTTAGGLGNVGTLFKLGTGSGPFAWQYSVGSIGGQDAFGPLACDGFSTLYGTTVLGGGAANRGLAFSISTSGTSAAAITQFSGTGYGGQPRSGLFVVDSSHLLGTSTVGGTYGKGVVYLLTYSGGSSYSYSTVYNFGAIASDGSDPWATLVADTTGNTLYGSTLAGGASGNGTVFKLVKGTGYTWTYTQLYSFSGSSDGANPYAALVVDGGNLYGTTKTGGANNYGTIFKLTP